MIFWYTIRNLIFKGYLFILIVKPNLDSDYSVVQLYVKIILVRQYAIQQSEI